MRDFARISSYDCAFLWFLLSAGQRVGRRAATAVLYRPCGACQVREEADPAAPPRLERARRGIQPLPQVAWVRRLAACNFNDVRPQGDAGMWLFDRCRCCPVALRSALSKAALAGSCVSRICDADAACLLTAPVTAVSQLSLRA